MLDNKLSCKSLPICLVNMSFLLFAYSSSLQVHNIFAYSKFYTKDETTLSSLFPTRVNHVSIIHELCGSLCMHLVFSFQNFTFYTRQSFTFSKLVYRREEEEEERNKSIKNARESSSWYISKNPHHKFLETGKSLSKLPKEKHSPSLLHISL